MLYNDEKYLVKISHLLDRFNKKSPTLWNCRCNLCGDSKTNSKKARGFFFPNRDNDGLMYTCHNCISLPFGAYLKRAFPEYYTQYRLDNLQNDSGKLIFDNVKKDVEVKKKASNIYLNISPRKSVILLEDLPSHHPAVSYMKTRGVIDLSGYLYANKFAQYVAEATNNAVEYEKVPNDSRIIIPLKSPTGEQWGFQGRALGTKDGVLRYITIKENKDDFCKVYGLDRFDKNRAGFIVEGPLDSSFLPNCVSMCGSSLDPKAVEYGYIIPENTIIIFDNEPRNSEIVKAMIKKVDEGFRVYVPSTLSTTIKDINDMVLSGWTKKELVENFVKNSYSGTIAKAMITRWRKC